ncbi:hypothetical protein [Hydrogenophaga sp.]|uniref:hypothetical protein n=1 Tax=Hydrogenophaga sp. TaxID=1904254 RepID=UPI001983F805|nr:hypothetical protein [Hydrogenophaga sp.]MBD3893141.1 hypothetical protein [Hydrogenophaga sp.]
MSAAQPVGTGWQLRQAGCGLALLLSAALALANPHRLDDSLTHTVPPQVQMQWRSAAHGAPQAGMEAWLHVNVHIDTRDWIGRSARIYLVLARDQPLSSMEAVWTTQGRLLAGRLVAGERALVFAGPITSAALQDQLQLRLRSEADWQSPSRRLDFHFELDAD